MRIEGGLALQNQLTKKIDAWLMLSLILGLMLAFLFLYTGYVIAPASRYFNNYESFYNSLSMSYGGVDTGELSEPGFEFLSYLIALLFSQNARLYFSIIIFVLILIELTEVACLFIGINWNFSSYYNYGSFLLLTVIILHKFIAFVVVNPLFG